MSKNFWGFPDTLSNAASVVKTIEEQCRDLEAQIASAQSSLNSLIRPEQRIDDTPPSSPKISSMHGGFISMAPLGALEDNYIVKTAAEMD